MDLCIDNATKIIALESKCEELFVQVDRLTKEKETAVQEIERLKDQVKLYYLVSLLILLSQCYYYLSFDYFLVLCFTSCTVFYLSLN